VLVVLTGMGADGTDGAREVKARGGQVLVEAEETCTVYGMPRAVADAGLADSVLALGELAPAVAELAGVRA
jgi:two-component system chemotaxis response regulator CheB